MKKIRNLLIATHCLLLVNLLPAQTADLTALQARLDRLADLKGLYEALAEAQPVAFDSLPRNKAGQVTSVGYRSMQHPEWPALPGNFYKLDVWPLGDGHFVLDDRNFDYNALQAAAELETVSKVSLKTTAMRMMSSSLASYAYGNPVYLTNLVVTAGMTAAFDIAGGTNNVPYDIQTTTNLVSPWQWLGIGYTSNRYTFNSQPSEMAFYRLAKPSKTMVVGWGGNAYGQTDVPYGTNTLLMVAAGYGFNLGLTTNGTVIGWGSSGAAGWVPSNLVGNVSMVAAAWNHNVALLTNGTVQAWGFNSPAIGYPLTDVPADLTNVVVISATGLHTLALRRDGTVTAWGFNAFGQTNVPATLTNVTAIAAGANHSLAVSNGFVVAWGYNNRGQRTVPSGLSNVVDVAASDNHSLALKADGTVVAWGDNTYGERSVPAGLSNVVAIAAGGSLDFLDTYMGYALPFSVALKKDGTVVNWGAGDLGKPIQGLNNVIGISSGLYHALAIRTGPPTPVITLQPTNQFKVAGSTVSYSTKGQGLYGVTYQWQTNGVNLPGATNTTLTLTNVQFAQQATYRAIITDNGGYGTIASSNASLTIVTPPTFIYQSTPTNQTTIYGKIISYAGIATALSMTNGYPISYRWQFNGTNISGVTTTNYSFTLKDETAGTYTLIASNAAGTASVSWQMSLTNFIDVAQDLLLIYNTNSPDSTFCLNYYLAHRPNVSGANVLGIGYVNTNAQYYFETITPVDFTNQMVNPLLSWLSANPSKRPQYVILFMDLPSRVNDYASTNIFYPYPGGLHPSVSYQLQSVAPNWQPYVTHLNMGMTNTVNRTNDCVGYINKLASIGVPITSNSPVLSASLGGYANTNYVLDGIRNGGPTIPPFFPYENYSGFGGAVSSTTNSLLAAGVHLSAICFYDGLIISNNVSAAPPHPVNVTNVAGYVCWGVHGGLSGTTTFDGTVKWYGNSGWWLIETIESHNGQQYGDQGKFTFWYSANAFGGANYSNTPIGAVSHTDEPNSGWNDNAIYFGLWASGKNFAICAWASKNTANFQAIGDPLIKQ